MPKAWTELPLWWLSSTGPYIHSAQGIEEVATEGIATPLEEPEPSDTVDSTPCVIGFLLNRSWRLSENWELGSRYGSYLQYVVLLTSLCLPLHFLWQSQWYLFGIIPYIEWFYAREYLGEVERLLEWLWFSERRAIKKKCGLTNMAYTMSHTSGWTRSDHAIEA